MRVPARALGLLVALYALTTTPVQAQNRGVYPLGMSATNSGVTPPPGFTYASQLLFYSRDVAVDSAGDTLPVSGENYVLMNMNTFVWVSQETALSGAHFSMAATLPLAKNDLTSDIGGRISGGAGFADSYYQPLILGWNREQFAVRVIYGFLAPTGRFSPGDSDNVGSGYWTHALSSGQTFYLSESKSLVLSAFEMYEFHTVQEGTHIHPGETLDIDYSAMKTLPLDTDLQLQVGLAGYEQRQTTATTGPMVSPAESRDRYAINALGPALSASFPNRRVTLGLKFFREFANRSSFQGYSVQLSGSTGF
jgi:hypothetical protein